MSIGKLDDITLVRMLAFLGVPCVLGGLAGLIFPPAIAYHGGLFVVLMLSVVAGISALWSP